MKELAEPSFVKRAGDMRYDGGLIGRYLVGGGECGSERERERE